MLSDSTRQLSTISWSTSQENVQIKNEAKEENEEKVMGGGSYFLILKDWAENSLCGGIPHAARNRFYIWKIFWISLVIAGLGLTCEGIISLIHTYYQYPVNVNLNMTYTNKLPFPSVTICNLNPVRASKVDRIPQEYHDLFNQVFENNSMLTGAGRTVILDKFHQVYNLMPYEVMLDTGHRANETILDCVFNGYACDISHFEEWVDPVYGVCFTFNIGLNTTTFERLPSLQSYRTGPMYGLSVEMLLDQDDYISALNDLAGAKLVITPTGRMPFPGDEGIYLHPGTHTSISVCLVNITRLPYPYESECINVDGPEAKDLDVFADYFNQRYHVTSCLKTCYQSYVLKFCGCGDSKIPINSNATKRLVANKTIDYRPCVTPSEMTCLHTVHHEFGDAYLDCSYCRVPCVDPSYEYSTSTAAWPNKQYLDMKLAFLAEMHPGLAAKLENSSVTPQENILKFNVHFAELNAEVIYEQRRYTPNSILSNVGGYLGLYLGVSFIAVFELVQLVVDLFLAAFKKGERPNKAKNTTSNKGSRVGSKAWT